MDDLDRAQEETTRHRNQALAEHRARISSTGPGAEACEDCGDPIPAKRRALVLGVTKCVACQRENEDGR